MAVGGGAASWLIEAAVGTRRIRPTMAEAVTVAKRQVPGEVDRVLGIAALAGRFTDNDLIAMLTCGLGRHAAEPIRTVKGLRATRNVAVVPLSLQPSPAGPHRPDHCGRY